MSIRENLAIALKRAKEKNNLSVAEFSKELGLPLSSLQSYLKGEKNPRADTLELLAKELHVPLAELVCGSPPGWEEAETVIRAAREFSRLTPERRERGIRIFLELTELFAEGDCNQ